jgi:hypothetical protein
MPHTRALPCPARLNARLKIPSRSSGFPARDLSFAPRPRQHWSEGLSRLVVSREDAKTRRETQQGAVTGVMTWQILAPRRNDTERNEKEGQGTRGNRHRKITQTGQQLARAQNIEHEHAHEHEHEHDERTSNPPAFVSIRGLKNATPQPPTPADSRPRLA